MKKLNDDIKNFGSSFNFTGIQQKIVKLDHFFQRQKTLTQKISNKFIFVPESNFLNYWSFVISFLLIYASYITPYRIVYFDKTDVNDIWFFIEALVDLLFFIDILICMNTCYYNDKGILIYSRIKIFTHYLKSWMIIDIIGIFPFALIETITESGDSSVDSNDHEDFFIMFKLPKLYRLIRIIRLFKLIKRAKKPKFIQSIEDFLHLTTANTRIIKFFFTCSVLIHIFGCLWYFAAKVNSFGPHTWIYEMGLTNENDFTLYLYSIYWSIATLSTAGYGDVHAHNEIEVTISIIWLIFGAGFYSFTLGSLSNLLANSNSKRTILSNKLTLMDQFCKENKFNKDLRFRLKKALEYASLKSLFSSNEKNELLEEIPIELKFKISENMFRGIINKIRFFKKKDKSFIAHFVTLLKPLRINQGEFIYRKNEYPNLIYFLFKGRVDYIVGPQNITFKTLVEGCYFGEIEVYQKVGRYFSCRAETLCDLLTISGENFKHIVCSYPDFEKEIKNVLKERKQRNLLALNNIQTIAQISKNSEFWNKKKDYNLYEVVKKKNRRNASLPSQKLWASKTLANEEKEGGKFKKFFTRLFTRRPTIHITKNDSQDSLVLPISEAALSSKKNDPKAGNTKNFSFAESEQKEQKEQKDKQNDNLKNSSLIEEKKSITLLNYENNESTTIHNNLSDKKQIEENNKNFDENISGSIKKRVSIHSPKNIEQDNLDEIKNEKKKNENELIIPLKASLKSPSNRKYSSGTPVSPLKIEKIEEMKSILESEKVIIYSEKTSDKNKINEKDNINDTNNFNTEKIEDNISQSLINSPEKNIESQLDKLPLQEEKGKKRIKSRLLRNNEIGNIVEQYHEFERRKTRIISADKQNINLKTFKNRIKIFKIMSITNNEKIDLLENETIDINEKLVKINKSLQDALNNFKILKQNPENKKVHLKDNSVEKEENYDKNEK